MRLINICFVSLFFSISQVYAIECVPYARDRSGINITGNAGTWWSQAVSLGYGRGLTPSAGSVLSMPPWDKNEYGHVAYVTKVISSTEIEVDHANWKSDGKILSAQRVKDVSGSNNWTKILIWWNDKSYGATEYSSNGFIYPKAIKDDFAKDNQSYEIHCAKNQYGSYIGWYPLSETCDQASQWFLLDSCTAREPTGSASVSSCPNGCYP